jgi:transcriptional regulator with XRE-family HTH domain
MKNKRESFVYEGLGFPIHLINVPMKKILGEWALDINFNMLQKSVLHMLVGKPTPLNGKELRFIMGYLELSTRRFAELFDVTHVAVIKWLNEEVKMNPNTEICLRLHVLDVLGVTDKEFKKQYLKIRQKDYRIRSCEQSPLEIDADKIAC